MACTQRERTGICKHTQCPHPIKTGLDCVEVVGMFCEIGEDCAPDCPYSWKKSDHRSARRARVAWADRIAELQEGMTRLERT